ncbi:metal-sensitive transcriptional regulator [Corynebacterium lubricantis]|uniref:metal-sensitive transcriptional regulator n=1 Tax=Corynebacterium lubricantis TaxID=541095 RepID=UPI00036CCCF1|nr:metal-sensitive transcriptional regulator [Corynebacterium lubricantis]
MSETNTTTLAPSEPTAAAAAVELEASSGEACHADHGYSAERAKYLARVKRIQGQVGGIHRMIDEDQYCIDILTQISAITSALENVGLALLEDHLNHCVTGAVEEGGDVADEKIAEAMTAIKRMVK